MSSNLKVNNIQNLAGDDSGIDLSTNDQIILKTANTTAITVDSSQNVTLAGNLTVTGTASGVGKVLQVVPHQNSAFNSTASATFVATNSAVTITPTSTNSKILIQTNAPLYGNNNNAHVYTTIYRDNINLAGGTSELQLFATGSDGMGRWSNGSMQFLDSPNTTSAVTYTVYLKNSTNGTSFYDANGGMAIITAMEIAG